MATRSGKVKHQMEPDPGVKAKRVTAYLDETRVRQVQEIQHKFGGNDSSTIAHAVSFWHSHLKKEWPDEFH